MIAVVESDRPCPHPLERVVDVHPMATTAGPERVWVGRCGLCGEPDVVVGTTGPEA